MVESNRDNARALLSLSLLQPLRFPALHPPLCLHHIIQPLTPSLISSRTDSLRTLLGFPPSILTTFVLSCSQSGSFGRFCAILRRGRFDIKQLERSEYLNVPGLKSGWKRRENGRIH